MQVEAFFDQSTYTLTYVVWDSQTRDALIIDPVLDYDPVSSAISYKSAQKILDFVQRSHLRVYFIVETHAHADHLSSSQYLKTKLGSLVVVSQEIQKVQAVFKGVFEFEGLETDGSQFDFLARDGEPFHAGNLTLLPIATPGHTEACYSYLIGDALFTGDALFMPDFGVGRCDFPNGSAEKLYESVMKRIYTLPEETKIYVGHDYQPGGRELKYESTVREEKEANIQLKWGTSMEDFVKFRTERDKKLTAPTLLYQSVQFNINGGRFISQGKEGNPFFRIPVYLP